MPVQMPLAVAGQHVAVNICYEDAFGEELIRQLPRATLLANFTNDAWWGDSFASEQHLQISQMRAQETGRYMLRATNTGVTAIIDQRGRVLAAAPQFVTTAAGRHRAGLLGQHAIRALGKLGGLVVAGAMVAVAFAKLLAAWPWRKLRHAGTEATHGSSTWLLRLGSRCGAMKHSRIRGFP